MFIELPEGVEMVIPGDNVEMTVELIASIIIENGTKFLIHEGGSRYLLYVFTEQGICMLMGSIKERTYHKAK